jgi:hypothetical protein
MQFLDSGRFIALIAFAVSLAEPAAAQSRPDTNRLSCAAAQALVIKERGSRTEHGPVALRSLCDLARLLPVYRPDRTRLCADNRQPAMLCRPHLQRP